VRLFYYKRGTHLPSMTKKRKPVGQFAKKPRARTPKESQKKKTTNLSPRTKAQLSINTGNTASQSTRKKTKGAVRKKKPESIKSLFIKLRDLMPKIERKNYFELDKSARQLLANFEGTSNGTPKIEAWTFTLHPTAISALRPEDRQLKRFILTIDALRSNVYETVKDFLETRKANITSYYTGGWADFLCDIQMDQASFDSFIEQLRSVLKEGIEKILGRGKVNDAISFFEVVDQIILCGKVMRGLPAPPSEAIEELIRDRARFEIVHRDYRSPEALALFDSEPKLKAYLRKLKSQGIIVCFDLIFDFSFGLSRDYVPMILSMDREGPIAKLLDDAKTEESLLKPVREWLKVRPLSAADEAEREVNYLFINEYDYPGQRTNWKQSIYKHTEIDVNLYNYPLESTLNESPLYLSDLPEFLNRVKQYERGTADRDLFVGHASHPLMREPTDVAWPLGGLGQQGVTLGDPGFGKTNMDLVLASEALKHLKTVVVFDPTGGIESKVDVLPPHARAKLTTAVVSVEADDSEVLDLLSSEGLTFLKCEQRNSPAAFSKLISAILSSADPTSSNTQRRVTRLLIVEEAGDALGDAPGDTGRNNVQQLMQLLNKAWRKGWCIWISTQRPTSLGYDEASAIKVLSMLGNRIISRIRNSVEVDLIVRTFRDEKYGETELEELASTLSQLPTGSAVCRATEKAESLSLLRIDFRLLNGA
jgi:hypothetical protein